MTHGVPHYSAGIWRIGVFGVQSIGVQSKHHTAEREYGRMKLLAMHCPGSTNSITALWCCQLGYLHCRFRFGSVCGTLQCGQLDAIRQRKHREAGRNGGIYGICTGRDREQTRTRCEEAALAQEIPRNILHDRHYQKETENQCLIIGL